MGVLTNTKLSVTSDNDIIVQIVEEYYLCIDCDIKESKTLSTLLEAYKANIIMSGSLPKGFAFTDNDEMKILLLDNSSLGCHIVIPSITEQLVINANTKPKS